MRIITRAQEIHRAEEINALVGSATDKLILLGRCFKALRDAQQFLNPQENFGKVVAKDDLLAEINSILLRQ